MATLRIILHPINKDKDGKRAIVMRFTLNRIKYFIDLGIRDKFYLSQLTDDGQIKPTSGIKHYKQINAYIRERLEYAYKILFDLERQNIPVTYWRFKEQFSSTIKDDKVFPYFEKISKDQELIGKIGNSGIYKTVSNSVFRFTKGNKDLHFTDIDKHFIERYAAFLIQNGLTGNGISLYMRTIRSTYNKAISDNLVDGSFYPFYNHNNPKGYKATQSETITRKKALTIEEIRKIEQMESVPYTALHDAKLYFLFSFYCRGINFTDIAALKSDNIENGRLIYLRSKTRKTQLLNLELLPPAIDILEYFKNHPQTYNYLFPILNSQKYPTPKSMKARIQTVLKDVNEQLKIIASNLNIDPRLSTNYARHSYATVLKKMGYSTETISESLAHTSIKTTQIYLDSFGNDKLDEISKSILE